MTLKSIHVQIRKLHLYLEGRSLTLWGTVSRRVTVETDPGRVL